MTDSSFHIARLVILPTVYGVLGDGGSGVGKKQGNALAVRGGVYNGRDLFLNLEPCTFSKGTVPAHL